MRPATRRAPRGRPGWAARRPRDAAAGLGAMGARRRTPSTVATPVSRSTSAMSPGVAGCHAGLRGFVCRHAQSRGQCRRDDRRRHDGLAHVGVGARDQDHRGHLRLTHRCHGVWRRRGPTDAPPVPAGPRRPRPTGGHGWGRERPLTVAPRRCRDARGLRAARLCERRSARPEEVLTVEVSARRDPEPGHAVGNAGRPEAAHEDALGAQVERRRDRAVGRRHRQRLHRAGRLLDPAGRRDGARVGTHRCRERRVARHDVRGRARGSGRGRREPRVEDEAPRGVDEVVAHGGRPEHGAALRAEGLRQRRRDDEVAGAGEAELVDETAPVPGHPDAVGLVDDEQGAMAVADLDEVAQGRGIAEDRVDRLDGDDDPPVGPGGQLARRGPPGRCGRRWRTARAPCGRRRAATHGRGRRGGSQPRDH